MKKIARDIVTAGFPFWIKDKTLQVNEIKKWINKETGQILGKRIEVVIVEDRTPYDYGDGEQYTNRFGILTFKCRTDVDLPIDSIIVPKNVKASIYGQYNNELSLYCEEFEIVRYAGQASHASISPSVKSDEPTTTTGAKGKTLA